MKITETLNYLYGPVESWRMGTSLGVDPLSKNTKICNLDCIYCQLGRTQHLCNERKIYIKTETILAEFDLLPPKLEVDYVTFSGRGEPTLASNLGELIQGVRDKTTFETAVITNSTLLHRADVRADLSRADLIIAKLDAVDECSFIQIDKAMPGISFEQTLTGLKRLRDEYTGTLAVQLMFVEQNRKFAGELAQLVREINADEIQINTPLRPSSAAPLDQDGITEIKSHFKGLPAVSVYDRERKESVPFSPAQTVKRHGNYIKIK
ncbi:MAG: radical SAM protein [Candidatus Omnitrophota bacterium]